MQLALRLERFCSIIYSSRFNQIFPNRFPGNSYIKKFLMYRFVVIILLSGCVNTAALYDDFSENEELKEVPNNWSQDFVNGSVSQSWVSEFDSKELTELVKQALRNNFSIRKQAALVMQSYALADAAYSGQLPNLNTNLEATRSARNSELLPEDYVYSNIFDANITLSWEPDIWGRLSSSAKSRVFKLQSAMAMYQQSLQRIGATLASSWYGLIACRQLAALGDERVARVEELLNAVNESYLLGLDNLLSVTNQQSLLVNERRSQLQQQANCRSRQRNMYLLLGQLQGDNVRVTGELPEFLDITSAGIPSDLLKNRPDILAARADLQASYENIAGARAARFPSLTLFARAARSDDYLNELLSQNYNTFSLAAALAIPLYSFGRLQAEENSAHSAARQAEITYIETIYTAIVDVENLLDTSATTKKSLELAYQTLQLAKESAEIAELQYTSGISDFNDWVNAELSCFTAKTTVINLQLQQIENRINLYQALGSSPLPVEELPEVEQYGDS